MKKMKTVLCLLLVLFLIAGCGQKEEQKEEPEPEKETKDVIAVPDKIQDLYVEEIAGRATLNVEGNQVTLIWPESYQKVTTWTMDVSYNEAEQKLEYEPARSETVTYNDKGEETETILTVNTQKGYLEIVEDALILHDEEILGKDRTAVFCKAEAVPEVWAFTEDLQEALTISGIEFDPPIKEALPPTVTFNTYGAIPGSIEAVYTNESSSVSLTVEKSKIDDENFTDLMKTYDYRWTENYKGISVDCAADKSNDDIHMAMIETADHFYRITYISNDGHGLDVDELGSLIMGMQ